MENVASKNCLEFNVQRWLKVDEDDGDIVRELPAVWPGKDPLPGTFVWANISCLLHAFPNPSD